MKKQLQKMVWLAIFIITIAYSHAQTAKGTWPLTATTTISGIATGAVSVAPQGLSRLAINGYSATIENAPLGELGQRLRHSFNSSTQWPQGSAYDPNRYAEYALTVSSGSFSYVMVSVPIRAVSSNNLRADIFYSTDNFATSTQLNTGGTLVLSQTAGTAWVTYTYNFSLALPSGTTFSLRVFPWYTSSDLSTSRYVSMQNVEVTLSTSPLPLKLLSFNTSMEGNKPQLLWKTTNELNMLGFDVEKGIDGRNFSAISYIIAKNGASNSYSFTDSKAISSKTYYRLRMKEKDGSFNYSQVLVVTGKTVFQLSTYPNPVTNAIVLKHPKASESAIVRIVGTDGKLISQFKVSETAMQSSFDVEKLTKGHYIAQYTDNSYISSVRFSKL